jgi:hypothetical protein
MFWFRNEEEMYEKGRPMEEQYVQDILPVKLELALAYSRTRTFRSDLEIILRTALGLRPPRAKRSAEALDAVFRIGRFAAESPTFRRVSFPRTGT